MLRMWQSGEFGSQQSSRWVLLACVAVLPLLTSLALTSLASAETVSSIGADGLAGANGGLAEPGGVGGSGEAGNALADQDPSNTADAVGGSGGAGGTAGPVFFEPGARAGGAGGAGGSGTAAAVSADSTLNVAVRAESSATGGQGGTAGFGGPIGGSGTIGPSGSGGIGGDATATTNADATATSSMGSAQLTTLTDAIGGRGGDGLNGGSGGNAAASTTGTGAGNILGFSIQSNAEAGSGGDNVLSSGLGSGGLGGDANAMATALGTIGRGSLVSEAVGGQGGRGFSSADVAGANGGDGGDATSAAGATITGPVTAAGSGTMLVVGSTASAGFGGRADGLGFVGGRGGDAIASSVVEDVLTSTSITVTSVGGRGGDGGDGADGGMAGNASLGRVYGSSANGSRLAIRGSATGGDGGSAIRTSLSPSGMGSDGGNAVVVNGVEGNTSGSFDLTQSARGGSGGDGDARAGNGGTARSALDQQFAGSSIRVRLDSTGGRGGATTSGRTGAGGDAISDLSIVSLEGSATIAAFAQGGDSGSTSRGSNTATAADSAGDATVDVYGEVRGDGFFLGVGRDRGVLRAGAFGGIGFGVPESGGLDAGPGATGGNASSRSVGVATGDSSVSVYDVAIGGPGRGIARLGGDGGAASSEAEGSNAGSRGVVIRARAVGGDGANARGEGSIPGVGGNAVAQARGSSTGGGNVDVAARQTSGGLDERLNLNLPTAGVGADSLMLNAVSGSTSGNLQLYQGATAGRGGPLGIGGTATSRLEARNEGGGSLDATAEATGGVRAGLAEAHIVVIDDTGAAIMGTAIATGGEAFDEGRRGGTAMASAEGTSTAGGDVTVMAIQNGGDGNFQRNGSGGHSTILNAVSGSTTGTLTLMQTAVGGAAGLGSSVMSPPQSGNSSSDIDATNGGGGDLVVSSTAIGGTGGRGRSGASGFAGAAGGDAFAAGRAIDLSGADVTLLVRAEGGLGDAFRTSSRNVGGNGGLASLGRVFGSSTSGTVRVEGTVVGGSGLGGNGFAGRGGRGADAIVSDAVDGETTGLLTLIQNATGGDNGGGSNTTDWTAGTASTVLRRSKSASLLSLEVNAQGGNQQDQYASAEAAPGGDASALVSAENDRGGVVVVARSIGGDGGEYRDLQGRAGNGGNASLRVDARTIGDGQDIVIGPSNQLFGARGGEGGDVTRSNSAALYGDGGDATSQSIGTALGDSAVTVFDRASGGRAARLLTSDAALGGGDGGDASSYAEARTAGASDATATAYGFGGLRGHVDARTGVRGDGIATALAEGAGAARAISWAMGTNGTARSSASGGLSALASSRSASTGDAEAIARLQGPGPISDTRVTTYQSGVQGSMNTASHVFYDGLEQTPVALSTASFANVRVAGPPAAGGSLLGPALAEIDLNLRGSGSAVVPNESRALIELALGTSVASPTRELFLDFDTDASQEAGFDSLRILISLGETTLLDETFLDVMSAIAFFSTAADLMLGSFDAIGTDRLSVLLEMESTGGQDNFAAMISLSQVPEPNMALLLLLGLGMLSLGRRHACSPSPGAGGLNLRR